MQWLFSSYKVYVVAVAVLGGGNAGMLLEGPVKVSGIAVTALDSDIQYVHRALCFIQHPFGFFNAFGSNVIPQFCVQAVFEQGGEVVWRNVALFGDLR